MFSEEELKKISRRKWKVYTANSGNVMLQSRSTGHYWQIHTAIGNKDPSCLIFHKHKKNHYYHCHCRANNLYHALAIIYLHDKWQLKGRPKVKKEDEI